MSDAALACIARMADGGMRDAQSILDQMISFCGSQIDEPDVLDVYGLVAASKVAELAEAVASGNHKKLVSIVDDCDAAGRDLVRLLSDLQVIARTALLDSIGKGGSSAQLGSVPMTTEQLTRLLDALREGEGSVKLGLAERINFEVTLLKAVEASRARAIDSLIKELAALADEAPEMADSEKKKGRIALLEERLLASSVAVSVQVVDVAEEDASVLSAPSEADEASFLASLEEEGPAIVVAPKELVGAGPLPELSTLVNRIPPSVREILDDLFRARFSSVRRVPAKSLKDS